MLGCFGRQVAGRNYPPTNKNTLIRALTEEWDKLPQQLLDNVVQKLSDRHPIHLQWVPYHVGLLGNEVKDDLAKTATSNPVVPENHMVLTSTEIYSRAKELICRTWVVPPLHP
ncbi:RNase H domain-containing protein [Trichonephila clavipes]|nr:RNase H domain-containing protein [Trichonephila clavipes]